MLLKTLLAIVLSVVITLAVAVVLVVSDPATSAAPVAATGGLDFADYLANTAGGTVAPPLQNATMRDGYALAYRRFDGPLGARMLVLVHGSGWHGLQFVQIAQQLSKKATVLVPDLRGHGAAPGGAGILITSTSLRMIWLI